MFSLRTHAGFCCAIHRKTRLLNGFRSRYPTPPDATATETGLMHFIPGPGNMKLYGAGILGRRLFEYDPTAGEYGKIRDYGTAFGDDGIDKYNHDVPLIRTMTAGNNGKIFLEARTDKMRIVSVDIESGEKTNYGIMRVDGFAPASAVSAAVGLDGTVYFGAWETRKDKGLPHQLILFNPDGVSKRPPEKYKNIQEPPDAPSARVPYEYYLSTINCNSVFVTRGTFFAKELGCQGANTAYTEKRMRRHCSGKRKWRAPFRGPRPDKEPISLPCFP